MSHNSTNIDVNTTISIMVNGALHTYNWVDFTAVLASSSSNVGSATAMNVFWLLFCSILVLMMQAGFVFVEIGSIHTKGAKAVVTKSLCECCISAISFYAISFTFAFVKGDNVFGFGDGYALKGSYSVDHWHPARISHGYNEAFWLFHWTVASFAASIVSGALMERVEYYAHFIFVTFFTILIYPPIVHWGWAQSGWASMYNIYSPARLFGVGVIDFAGSGIVHVTGGIAALVGCRIIGTRRDRFDEFGEALDDELFTIKNQRSLPWQSIGTLLLWIGWYGIVGGSSLRISGISAQVATTASVNLTIAAAVSGISTLIWSKLTTYIGSERSPMACITANNLAKGNSGILAGLVGISAGCATVEPEAAIIIGFVSSLLYFFSSRYMLRHEIDDAVDAVPIHLVCGSWGLIAAGIFSTKVQYTAALGDTYDAISCGLFYTCHGNGKYQLAANVLFLVAVAGWAGFLSASILIPLHLFGCLRVRESDAQEFERTRAESAPKQDELFAIGSSYRVKTGAIRGELTQL